MTDVDEADHLASVIAGAWRGDPACLNTLRGWVGTDAPGTPSTVYHVGPEGLLRDPSKRAASKRSDVYLSFAPFGRRDPRWHAMTISDAIDEVCDCPPLAKVFEAAALSHYNRLEMRLLTDQNLGARGQATIRQQLKELAAPGRPVWINWVHATPSWQRDKFDRLTRDWLRQPIDLAEAQWFAPGWRCRDIQSAADDFLFMGSTRLFFEVDLQDGQHLGLEHCAVLESSVEQANLRAQTLQVAIRFAEEPAPELPAASAD